MSAKNDPRGACPGSLKMPLSAATHEERCSSCYGKVELDGAKTAQHVAKKGQWPTTQWKQDHALMADEVAEWDRLRPEWEAEMRRLAEAEKR